MREARWVEKNGMEAKGKSELIKHLSGERLPVEDAILAFCYECAYFGFGEIECPSKNCPLRPYSQFGDRQKERTEARDMSDKHCLECMQLLREVTILAGSVIAETGVGVCPSCGWHGGTHSRECVITKARRYLAKSGGAMP